MPFKLTALSGFAAVARPIAIEPEFDLFWDDVVLLLPLNDIDGATTTEDKSNFNRTPTFEAGAEIDTARSKFGTSSLLGDGSSTNKITFLDSPELEFANDFTVEGWLQFDTGTLGGVIWGKWDTTTNRGMRQWLGTDKTLRVDFFDSAGTLYDPVSAAQTIDFDVWYHFALCLDGDTLRSFWNGIEVTTTAITPGERLRDTTSLFTIGDDQTSGFPLGNTNVAWIDDFRVTRNIARYTSNFTPPIFPFPTVGEPISFSGWVEDGYPSIIKPPLEGSYAGLVGPEWDWFWARARSVISLQTAEGQQTFDYGQGKTVLFVGSPAYSVGNRGIELDLINDTSVRYINLGNSGRLCPGEMGLFWFGQPVVQISGSGDGNRQSIIERDFTSNSEPFYSYKLYFAASNDSQDVLAQWNQDGIRRGFFNNTSFSFSGFSDLALSIKDGDQEFWFNGASIITSTHSGTIVDYGTQTRQGVGIINVTSEMRGKTSVAYIVEGGFSQSEVDQLHEDPFGPITII